MAMGDCQHEWADVSSDASPDEREFLCGKCQARRIDGTYPAIMTKAEPQLELTQAPMLLEHIGNLLDAPPDSVIRACVPEIGHTPWTMEIPTTPGWYWFRGNPPSP